MAVAMSLPDSWSRREHQQVDQGQGDADERQDHVVPKHEGRVEDGRDQPDDAGGQITGQDGGHRLVARDPVADLAGVALGEELHRQPQHVPQKLSRRGDRQLGLRPHQEVLLQRRERRPQHGRHPHAHQQGPQPALRSADEDLVDEDLGEGRDRQPGDDQPQPGQHAERHRDPHAPGPLAQGPRHAGLAAPALEVRPGREGHEEAGEALVELLEGHRAPPVGGVVEIHAVAAERLDDQEVVEVPEGQEGKPDLAEALQLGLEGLRLHAVALGGRDHVAGIAPVARDPAVHAELLQGHPPPVVGEDDAQARGPALDRLHLEIRRRPDARGARQALGERWLLVAHRSRISPSPASS
jgi:hypothetical protein